MPTATAAQLMWGACRTALALLAACAPLALPTRVGAAGAPPAISFTEAGDAALVPSTTSAAITPLFTPDRLGAKSALTITVGYSSSVSGVPQPVRTSVLRLPAGLSLEIPSLRSCSPAQLLRRGVSGCPRQSEIGRGHALAEVLAGSLRLTESVGLWVFLGEPGSAGPTFEILARGYTPLDERMVFSGTVLSGSAPYGEELALTIPPIPTLPYEPDASIVALSLTIGASERHRAHDVNTVVIPSRCPSGGFPFAAEFTYADGSSGSAVAAAPCPPPARGAASHRATRQARARAATERQTHAHASRTTTLNESGHLRLTSKHGFTLNEQGSATGTAVGTIYAHLTAVSTSRLTVEVNIYPRGGGSISGYGTGTYHKVDGAANFSGTMSIGRGSGSYTDIHGAGLAFGGTIEESDDDAIAVHVSGKVSD